MIDVCIYKGFTYHLMFNSCKYCIEAHWLLITSPPPVFFPEPTKVHDQKIVSGYVHRKIEIDKSQVKQQFIHTTPRYDSVASMKIENWSNQTFVHKKHPPQENYHGGRFPSESLPKRQTTLLSKKCDIVLLKEKRGHEDFLFLQGSPPQKKRKRPKDHWTLKTGYFEDPTPAIQVQTLPLEGPRCLGRANFWGFINLGLPIFLPPGFQATGINILHWPVFHGTVIEVRTSRLGYRIQGLHQSWWLNQPCLKNMCKSNWIVFPQVSGWTIQKYVKPPPRRTLPKTNSKRPWQ